MADGVTGMLFMLDKKSRKANADINHLTTENRNLHSTVRRLETHMYQCEQEIKELKKMIDRLSEK